MSAFPIATIMNISQEIVTQVQIAKANRRICRRVGSEVEALMPVVQNVAQKYPSLPQNEKDLITKALEMLYRDLEEAFQFVQMQSGNGNSKVVTSIKKFVMARGINTEFEEINQKIQNAKSTLMFALVNQIHSNQVDGVQTQLQNVSLQEKRALPQAVPKKEQILQKLNVGDFQGAVAIAQQLLRSPEDPTDSQFAHYALACVSAQSGKVDQAITHLYSAKQFGFVDYQQMETDADFASMRNHPDFIKLRNQMEQEVFHKERWRRLPQSKVDDIVRIFDTYDTDGNGEIELKEFQVLMMRTSDEGQNPEHVKKIFESLDIDHNGCVSLNEYLNYMADHFSENKTLQSLPAQQPHLIQQQPQQQQFAYQYNQNPTGYAQQNAHNPYQYAPQQNVVQQQYYVQPPQQQILTNSSNNTYNEGQRGIVEDKSKDKDKKDDKKGKDKKDDKKDKKDKDNKSDKKDKDKKDDKKDDKKGKDKKDNKKDDKKDKDKKKDKKK